MLMVRLMFCVLFVLAPISLAVEAAPKKGPGGETCTRTGTERKDGKDQSGNTVNCLWDTCTYCSTSGGKIDCSVLKTSYSNPRDCKAASIRPPARAPFMQRAPIQAK